MNNAAKSMAVFGIYLVISGSGLMVIPNALISLVGLPPTHDMWIRMLGAIIAILGLYYIQAARQNDMVFFRMTLWGRILVFVLFGGLALTGSAAPIVAVAGLIDFSCALWTWLALRQQGVTSVRRVEGS